MSNKKRIILITILSIILVALLTAFVFATINFASSKKAHAEYDDITSETVVNFNQQILLNSSPYNTITIINGQGFIFDTYSSNSYIDFRAQIYSNHKYYCYISNPITSNIELTVNGVPLIVVNNQYGIYTPNQSGICDRLYLISGFTAGTYYINLIDLSQMFGNGNEPNLEQCQQLFTANYYNYTKGQAMFFGVNQNDMFNNLDYQFNTGLVSGYEQNITNSTVSYNDNGQLIFNAKYNANYTPYWLINFKTVIPKGSIITINLNSYTTQSGVAFGISYADENEQNITSIPQTQNTNAPFSYSFMNDKDLSALYLIESGSTFTNGTILTILNGSINVQLVNDYKFNLQAQYDLGYSDAETYYTDGYGRQIIWSEGYDAGYTRGVSEGSLSDGWTFLSTLFGGISTIFSLEIFPNITVGTFVMIPLLLGLVFFIVKLSRGGS